MFGTATLFTAKYSDAVLIPKAALIREEGTSDGAVFVVDNKKVAHKREVTVGENVGDQVQIASGLKPGETIVVEGAYGLPDKAQVTAKGSSASKEDEKE